MAVVRRVVGFVAAVVVLILVFGGGWVTGRFGIGDAGVDPASLTDAERQFTERMRNVTLRGNFTVDGRGDRTPREDRYDIESVEKVGDDLWRFNAGMKCCGVNGVIPIVDPDALRRRHGDDHDDRHEPAGARHVHRPPDLLWRSLRRHMAARARSAA